MLLIVCIFLLLVMFLSRRTKGPLWAFSAIWLISMTPIAMGWLRFEYFSNWDPGYELTLLAYMACFVFGVLYKDHISKPGKIPAPRSPLIEARSALPWARAAWWAAAVGTVCLCIDFVQMDGAGLDDLATLRDAYIGREASIFAKLGSILSWGCLYCFAYALIFRDSLSKRRFFVYMAPIAGYFLVALFSAGRQASMQILIFALLILALKRSQSRQPTGLPIMKKRSGLIMALTISIAMVGYMGYVAGARNDANISEDKSEVLARLFDFTLAPGLDTALQSAGSGLRTTFVEAVIYFSSPVALFAKFFEAKQKYPTLGAMTFPFVLRQLEPLTDMSVAGALDDRVEMMRDVGVIGAGWTTAISNHIMDFGFIGAGLFLFAQGYYSAYAWRRARYGSDFHHNVIALLLLTSAIYTPLIPAISDTNILILWLYCLLAIWQTRRASKRKSRPHPRLEPTASASKS